MDEERTCRTDGPTHGERGGTGGGCAERPLSPLAVRGSRGPFWGVHTKWSKSVCVAGPLCPVRSQTWGVSTLHEGGRHPSPQYGDCVE